MKLASYTIDGRTSYGLVDTAAQTVTDLGAAWAGQLPTLLDAIAAGALTPVGIADQAGLQVHAFGAIRFDLPIPNPPKIMLVGRNYIGHVAEGKNTKLPERPGVFLRALSSLVAHQSPMISPNTENRHFDYEGELAVIIGKPGRAVDKADALAHVFGYTCFNDGSERDIQDNIQVIFGKNFPATGGFGPWITTTDEIPDPSRLTLTTRLNGQQMQHSGTDDLIFDVPTIVSYISQYTPLQPGDLIATGTPDGVGKARKPPVWMQPGDTIEVEISGIGTLRNPIANQAR